MVLNSKKGIMFTIVSVLVCALIITSFFTFQNVSLDSDVENTKLRIKSIDRFANDADAYVGSLVYRSGKSALDFSVGIMIGNNSFLENYTQEFKRCLLTGNMSVPWSAQQIRCPESAHLAGEFESFEHFSNKNLNLESQITLNGVGIEQEDPWHIIVYSNYTLVVVDSYAFWNETRITRTKISIQGLRDPTYAIINTSNNMNIELYPIRDASQVINVSPINVWFESPSTANSVVMNGSYFSWRGAPSYLERLEGIKNPQDRNNFSGSNGATCTTRIGGCGIVSIITADRMDRYAQGHQDIINQAHTRSSIDFEFWNNIPLTTFEQRHAYGRYNFWNVYFDFNAERTAMGINWTNANFGLNNTIISDELMDQINMTSAWYTLALD